MKEALYYRIHKADAVQCVLCPHNCLIAEGNTGFCQARKNVAGKLYSLIYGKTSGIALDPIEKKPLYHYHQGESILSLGTGGCNLKCQFCQNWHISQNLDVYLKDISSEEIVKEALRLKTFGIAYTYNEPFIWYEFVLETAKLAKSKGLENVLVTNGYMNIAPLEEMLPFIGAMNIDLKAMDDGFYRKICKGALEPVLATIKRAKKECHIELTNLVIPTLNDSDEHFEKITDWVFENTGADTVLHFSRYFPCYQLNLPATPAETLKRAQVIAKKKLKYVYLGNI
ncbi:MAG: AmmeMemoRadiSam system radical SAM enzyme [Candidatus Omnitrophica bacterium]|nr:AmmeMemoRadiSam system radical SAM enzyme [Candidatus Omnitrophota bacterium]